MIAVRQRLDLFSVYNYKFKSLFLKFAQVVFISWMVHEYEHLDPVKALPSYTIYHYIKCLHDHCLSASISIWPSLLSCELTGSRSVQVFLSTPWLTSQSRIGASQGYQTAWDERYRPLLFSASCGHLCFCLSITCSTLCAFLLHSKYHTLFPERVDPRFPKPACYIIPQSVKRTKDWLSNAEFNIIKDFSESVQLHTLILIHSILTCSVTT